MASSPPLVALKGVSITYGGPSLFENVDIAIGRGEKACLVGRNGSGKSTLMKALAGLIHVDHGERFLQPGTHVAYLAQEPDFSAFETVHDVVASGLPAGFIDEAHRVEAVLDRLDLPGSRAASTLSGGEARRAAMACALVSQPDVLLLDEPTNHLDLPTIEWLEEELLAYRGGLLLISHDRAFLKRLARQTLWLDRGAIRETERGFAEFEAWQAEVFASEEVAAQKLDRKISTEMKWLREGISARRTRNMGRVRALMDLRRDREERVRGDRSVAMAVSEGEKSGRLVIEAENIAKSFDTADGTRWIVRDFSSRILRGDRVGVIGPNGAGKSTLLQLLTGQMAPDAGTVRLGTNLQPVYFDQRRAALDPEATIRQTLCPYGGDTVAVGGVKKHVAGYVKDFLFDSRQLDQPARALSGGERNRLLLAKLFAQPSNMMILDEPTNDLDMDTLDLLQEVLMDYDGTLLLVSHDRDFLDRLVTSTIAVEGDGKVQEYVGGYSDYLIQRPPATTGRTPAKMPESVKARSAAPAAPTPPRAKKKLSFKEQRELDELPGRMDKLADEIKTLETRLADPGLYARDAALFQKTSATLATRQTELAAAEERWLELEALREELERAS